MAERVSSLLRRSVEHLENEVPDSYRLLVSELGPLVVQIDVDGEVFTLRGGDRLRVSEGAAQPGDARIATSRVAILDLLDARVGLGEAVEAGAVCVHGSSMTSSVLTTRCGHTSMPRSGRPRCPYC